MYFSGWGFFWDKVLLGRQKIKFFGTLVEYRLTLYSIPSYLGLPNTRIIGVCHHA
jgi:hypothetical protein